ncbi:hypothetical protein MuYL_1142 [Mucilaginibacter xinganensis]|uniref:Uncharacterized protein n=1 Tax=Mucilaginibacter xinganensis TaxID=1234841 RepID=A0A223NT25_9SPHI|nr:hypothetical protein MuYL_1142 [Mucilaginibacter xinganensis]
MLIVLDYFFSEGHNGVRNLFDKINPINPFITLFYAKKNK